MGTNHEAAAAMEAAQGPHLPPGSDLLVLFHCATTTALEACAAAAPAAGAGPGASPGEPPAPLAPAAGTGNLMGSDEAEIALVLYTLYDVRQNKVRERGMQFFC